jgi:hypothetical protein
MMVISSLMIEMAVHLRLLRIYNWMVATIFMLLTVCCASGYASIEAGIIGICMMVAIYMLFLTYKVPNDVRHTYCAYLAIGVGSLIFVKTLYFVPLMWVLTAFLLQSLNWRTLSSSLVGLVTPYWLALPWYIFKQEYEGVITHFLPLFHLPVSDGEVVLRPIQVTVFVFVAVLAIIGMVNFWRKNYEESIRIRMFFYFFQWMGLATGVFVLLQPQHYDTFMRILLICASPVIAHFFALTKLRIVNYMFFCVLGLVIAFTFFSFNEPLLNDFPNALLQLWNG